MVRKVLLLVALTLPMLSTAYAQRQFSASGQIVSARVIARTMTVRDASSNEVIRYEVPRNANITMADRPARLGLLRSGDMVSINYMNTDNGRQASSVSVPEPTSAMDMREREGEVSTITGRVESVNTRNRTITVLGDQSGQRFTYAIPEAARVTVGGADARVGQLQVGDSVVLRFTGTDQQRQAQRIRVPRPTTPLAQRPVPAGNVAGQAPRTQLPRTASSMPWFVLFGGLCLLGGISLTLRRYTQRS